MVQLLTGLVLAAALLSGRGHPFLRGLAAMEGSVQTVELVFYLYIVRTLTSHDSIRSMAAKRYADWFLTTPVMLFTLAGYFSFDRGDPSTSRSLGSFFRTHAGRLAGMATANLLMLLAGVLGEIGAIPVMAAAAAGFMAYAAAFWQLYGFLDAPASAKAPAAEGLLPPVPASGAAHALFWAVAAAWALYGVAYLFPPAAKNASYNYLDLVAKNFFGAFLSVRLLASSFAPARGR